MKVNSQEHAMRRLLATNRTLARPRFPTGLLLLARIAVLVAWQQLSVASTIQYTYDSAGRLVAEDYGGGKVAGYIYDNNGNLLTNATVIATNADVRIPSMSSVSPGANAGGTVTYTISVNNNGPHPATGVVLTDPLPFGILFTGASSSQGTCTVTGRTVTCNIGVLQSGSTITVTIAGIRAFEGMFTNVVIVSSAVPDPNPTNNTNSVTVSATAPFDADGDGMPNWWEQMHGLVHISDGGSGDNGADGDPDLDGVRNFDEWVADTDPLDPNSYFHVSAVGHEGNLTALEFLSSSIRRYHAQFTPDLNLSLTNILSFDGTGGVISILHTNGSGGYYQLQAESP